MSSCQAGRRSTGTIGVPTSLPFLATYADTGLLVREPPIRRPMLHFVFKSVALLTASQADTGLATRPQQVVTSRARTRVVAQGVFVDPGASVPPIQSAQKVPHHALNYFSYRSENPLSKRSLHTSALVTTLTPGGFQFRSSAISANL